MKFLSEDFLLKNEVAKKLYHTYAENQPIIDYHSHLVAKDIYDNVQYRNLTQVWLFDAGFGDHYKWRLLRANGEPESLVTGDGDEYEKYLAFVRALEKAPGNPIYEWSHLELRRYFGIELQINQKNAPEIWRLANEKLQQPEFRAREMVKMMNVTCLTTTDDPIDNLKYHELLAEEEKAFKVLPAFRPDKVWAIQNPIFKSYIEKLSQVSNIEIKSFSDYKKALASRIDFFHAHGGRLADHGLNSFHYASAGEAELEAIFAKAASGSINFSEEEVAQFTTEVCLYLMKEYKARNWVLQFHMNCFRNDSTQMFENFGPDAGADSMGDQPALTENIVKLFDRANTADALPRSIVYSLNPNDWLPIVSALQSFQGEVRQKLQLGNAWWFNDTVDGMRLQLTTMAQQSLLANITGMLTDSRSFLSYPRHEYFRRILCELLGEWVEEGRLPEDDEWLGQIVQDICYNNAYRYFGFFDN